MGPGARPAQSGDAASPPRGGLSDIIKIRSKYTVAVEPEVLQLGYEIHDVPRMYRLPFESMPLGSFSRWLLYGGPKRARTAGAQVIDVIRRVDEVTHEPVTQREAEGIAYHLSRASRYRLTGDLVACTLGSYIAYRNREKMKFPFLSPKPMERYNNFPSRHLPLLQGQYARVLWHITRINMWVGLFIIGLGPVFSSMGNFAAWRGIYTDERTQGVVQGLLRHRKGADDGLPNAGHAQQRPGRQLPSGAGYDGPDQQEYYDNKDSSATYDYSATRQYYSGRAYPEGPTDSGIVSDSALRSQEAGRWSSGSSYATPAGSTPQVQSGRDDRSSGSDFFDDEASPTAGTEPDTVPYGSPKGSAWARLRSGNRPANAQRGAESGQQPRTAEVMGSGGWRSREAPEQLPGQTAQKMSQREFDEMLERERRLAGSDEYSRGMRAVESGQDHTPESGSETGAWDRKRNW